MTMLRKCRSLTIIVTYHLNRSQQMYGFMLITLEPDRVAPAVLSIIDVVIAIGRDPSATLKIFCETHAHRLTTTRRVAWASR